MRRKDREITDITEIRKVISECTYLRLGFYDEGEIYIVPLNFGFETKDDVDIFYFHGAHEGRKIDLIKKSNSVGFEMDTDYALNSGERAIDFSARFKSVIGTGKVEFIDEKSAKIHALNVLMFQSTGRDNWEFTESELNSVCIFKLVVQKMSCKFHL